jgi:hypothetical protein
MTENYRNENDAERTRLSALLDRLNEASLQRTLPNGWTVAAALAHLAFWDNYAIALLDEWKQKGFSSPAAQYDAINAAVESMSRAIPFAALVSWVRESAEASDRAAANASPALAAELEAAGKANFLRRSVHRRHHLDQIKTLLGA